ncbi:MAG: CDP-diacylglycerol--glycerol-3-phosphate 3-phosphatidyltransferase [Thiotrichales bacterium]
MTMNIPNLLTLLRIVMIPLIVAIYYLPWVHAGAVAAILFALAGVTDWFDGYLARRLNQTSSFGAFLDPVADKLMVAAILVMVVDRHSGLWLTLAAIIIIGREITVSALREWMSEIGQRHKVAVSSIGKIKTTAQMVALFFLLYHERLLGLPSYEIGLALLSIAAILTLWSMVEYLKVAWEEM